MQFRIVYKRIWALTLAGGTVVPDCLMKKRGAPECGKDKMNGTTVAPEGSSKTWSNSATRCWGRMWFTIVFWGANLRICNSRLAEHCCCITSDKLMSKIEAWKMSSKEGLLLQMRSNEGVNGCVWSWCLFSIGQLKDIVFKFEKLQMQWLRWVVEQVCQQTHGANLCANPTTCYGPAINSINNLVSGPNSSWFVFSNANTGPKRKHPIEGWLFCITSCCEWNQWIGPYNVHNKDVFVIVSLMSNVTKSMIVVPSLNCFCTCSLALQLTCKWKDRLE